MLKVTGIRKAFKDNEVLKGVDLEVKKRGCGEHSRS